MTAPLPHSDLSADRPELPRVRLEVRSGSGRPIGYEVGGEEFLIGAAAGCDLRIPLPSLPPVVCQILRKPDGIRIRRLTPVIAVALNGVQLPANIPSPVRSGDILKLAGLDIVIAIQDEPLVVPHFVPLTDEPSTVTPPVSRSTEEERKLEERRRALDAEEAARRVEWKRKEHELARRAEDLDRQTEDLESDRVIWYRRRQELEQEHQTKQSGLTQAAERAAELDARERKLQELNDELVTLRQKLSEEFQEKRAELARQLNAVRDIREKERGFQGREEAIQADRDVLDRDRAQFQEDLVRIERRTTALEEQEQSAAARAREVDVRLEQLKRDAAEWEATLKLATEEQDRQRAEADRLDRQKTELDRQSAALAERAGQLEAQQAMLAVLRSQLERTRQEAERETAQLAAARSREDEALAELRGRIHEAEELRAELATARESAVEEQKRLQERDTLLSVSLEEIRRQQEAVTAEAARLQHREAELDTRAAEFAEQVGTLKGRMAQALDLQARLEADRVALRERESALAQAEEARQTLQEQLRRRAEDLAARARSLDEIARQVAADRAAIDQARASIENDRLATADELAERQRNIDQRAAEVERAAAEYAEKEQTLERQVARLRDVGAAVAAEREELAETREKWEAERAVALESDRKAREELVAFRAQALAEIEELRRQAPELEARAEAALSRLASARDTLRGHLTELNDFARLSRDDLATLRAQVRQEAERLREQEESLNRAKAEHRMSVTAFRQQLIDWQGQVSEMKRLLTGSESRLDARQAALDEVAKQVDATTVQLAEQAEQLRRERAMVSTRRIEVERHLSDMREWYRKKLRELAGTRSAAGSEGDSRLAAASDGSLADAPLADSPATIPAGTTPGLRIAAESLDELDPGDRQLGELLRSHGLVDADTLTALWAEAARQRRTLRQVLLASGVITLYQLAFIEAGNLDGLMLGRFRVIDRLRVSPREAIYRVFDPTDRGRSEASRPADAPPGVYLLRHLSEAEMQDAVHPDEFRQRFAAAHDASNPNLAAVVEVLEIGGRPAVLQEWLTGLFSADWPGQAAHPGCWVRLATMAATGIEAAHRHGLVHGRLTSDSFVLTAAGILKVTGFGEPPWLAVGPIPAEATPAADLRAFGQVCFGWSQLLLKRKGVAKPKPFPEPLLAIIRRLEADPEPPMADTVAAEQPYESAAELLADLHRIARETPFSDDAWDKLLKHVADNAPQASGELKKSA